MIVVVCGVSGTGKTTIGQLLAEKLKLSFYDADDFHPAANIEKMSSGIPLTDLDRRPWLEQIAAQLPEWQKTGGAVLACSALKASYRTILASQVGDLIHWVTLTAPVSVIRERLRSRRGHFFDETLLSAQLQDFEVPSQGITVDVSASPAEIVSEVVCAIQQDVQRNNQKKRVR